MPTHGHGQAFARMRAHACPHLYNPRPWGHFLLFFFCLLVGDLDFALATPISTCKKKGVARILRGIPLHLRVVYILEMLVYLVLQVIFVKTLEHRQRRIRRPFLGIYKCDGFFGGWCGPFEVH